MEYINPLFNHSSPEQTSTNKSKVSKKRKTRIDKQHNIKFPVTPSLQMQLRSLYRQAIRIQKERGLEPTLSQSKFNTCLLSFGLKNLDIARFNLPYEDTKRYMHTYLLEREYELHIGGPYGLTIQKNVSDRKIVYFIIRSVVDYIERGGKIEEVL